MKFHNVVHIVDVGFVLTIYIPHGTIFRNRFNPFTAQIFIADRRKFLFYAPSKKMTPMWFKSSNNYDQNFILGMWSHLPNPDNKNFAIFFGSSTYIFLELRSKIASIKTAILEIYTWRWISNFLFSAKYVLINLIWSWGSLTPKLFGLQNVSKRHQILLT